MTCRDNRPDDAAGLRGRAEWASREEAAEPQKNIEAPGPEETRRMLHELRVHQIELELQNEELQRSQAELDASRARYFDLFDMAPVGYVTVSENGLVVETNFTAATLLNVNRAALVGQPISRFILDEDQDIYYLHRKQLFETGAAQVCEFRMVRADNPPFWARLEARVVHDENGAPLCRVVMIDISERKWVEAEHQKLQAQLNQAQKMESVGRLAGGVAHDFNNMLCVIIGRTELAMETMTPDDPHYNTFKEILGAARHSAEITRQMLAFARKQIISPKVIDLNETVGGMLNMLRRLIGENIHLSWLPGENVWPIRMDPSQIDQILANLCVNARDAIAGVGKVTIETANVCLDSDYCAVHAGFVPGDFVMLVVSDNGCGMDHKTLANIFEPFFTTKDVDKGTGLGLAMIYGIVKQNKGFINVYSEPDKGAVFKIYLPRYESITGPVFMKEVPVAPDARGSETILLVEDQPELLRMTELILERLGYTVLDAVSPGAASRLVEVYPGRIHLLVTDVIMPEMNGRDLAGKLMALSPDLKCLFMSGYSASVLADQGVLAEGMHFIQKPFSMTDLGVKVRQAIDGD